MSTNPKISWEKFVYKTPKNNRIEVIRELVDDQDYWDLEES